MIESELYNKLSERMYTYRNSFYNITLQSYNELLLSIITYEFDNNFNIDSLTLEYLLRYYGNAVIGLCRDNKFRVIGYVTDYNNFFNKQSTQLTKNSITFLTQKELLVDDYKEITYNHKGNFVVLTNKPLFINNLSDFKIIESYVTKLTEIEVSEFSLVQQARVNTFLRGQADDEDVNELLKNIYNGSPYLLVTENLIPEDMVISVDGVKVTSSFKELKNMKNSTRNEINEYFGIDTAGVSKESGVSQSEIDSNNDYLGVRLLTYLDARNNKLNLIKRYYGYECHAISNPQSSKMITDVAKYNEKKSGGTEWNLQLP